ncbi:pancreatic lipase-related protein 2 [Ochlerotatus camptorhynchus]|uniref:pancreatic lipase-related protein 2 n=1 Tax=Ochlerotatus camptorhynchus TaxID=644619 RepID=UPI0031DC6FE4
MHSVAIENQLKENMPSVLLLYLFLRFGCPAAQHTPFEDELAQVKLYYYASTTHDVDISENGPLSEFDAQKQLKVIVHGWNANRHQLALTPVQNAYLSQNKHNILAADWANIASKPYPIARELTRALGYRIGSILSTFVANMNISYDRVHVIGHSLGAHIAGNIGKYFGGKLSRITALDPAGPHFVTLSTDAIAHSDAHFVDAIHSDIILGETVHRAHIDFYPNRGLSSQPGCEALDILTLHACSHYRAPAFFAESILIPENFIAHECELKKILSSPSACMLVEIRSKQRKYVIMGEYVNQSTRGTFYLQTSNLPPYGIGNRAVRRR